MINRKWIAKGAALFACAVMMNGLPVHAEEKRLGDYVYVPAMQVNQAAGAISLRVEGLALGAETDAPQTVEALAGAEFGVYVYSGSGELTPWANPLYPSEPMRIRTGEGETRFSLPQGAQYYLRQESAPEGYLFDSETLIPVTGEEIVVQNAMAGQLLISAVDSLGAPVAGVQIEVTDEAGEAHALVTDANGEAVFTCAQPQRCIVREAGLPEGVFAARSVTGGEAAGEGVTVDVAPATRARVTFEHPASGTVRLDVQYAVIDDNAQTVTQPLAGVQMEILSDPAVSVVTDAQGQASASLLEGTYAVRLRYAGEERAVLPVTEGQMIVESGSTTLIELTATQATGRIVLLAHSENALDGGSVTLQCVETGEEFGPYALDAEGMAVSEPLEAGTYRVHALTVDGDFVFGGISCEGAQAQEADGLALTVRGGAVTQAEIELLTREKQLFGLVIEQLDEQGQAQQEAMGESLTLTLEDEAGAAVAQVETALGIASIEALSGTYTLRMEERDAHELGVQPVSRPFTLPSVQETIVFPSESTRILISSVDETDAPAGGAVYQLTDCTGARFEVTCDADGMAVSPLLAVGDVTVETLDAPAGHAKADAQTVQAKAGEAVRAVIAHERYGSVALSVRMQRLNEAGEAVYAPMSGVQVRISREDGADITLETDEDGRASAVLEAGEYEAVVNEKALSTGVRAQEPVRFTVSNTQETQVDAVCLDALGGVRVRLTGGTLSDAQMAQVRFELVDADGTHIEMSLQDGALYVGGLAAGEYALHQTQMPQGYALADARSVTVSGGEVAEVSVPLEEYAVLTVSKTGLTFDNALRTYIVPLSGEYAVFTKEDGAMKPYPSEDAQMTVWANVTAQEVAQGKADSVKLPADVEGTTYYLHERSSAAGFAADETYYEVVLRAGETVKLECAVSSDRGFFALDTVDAATGEHIAGGTYELIDANSGEVELSFEMGEAAYQNAMAVPVGQYVLRQTQAAPGYALSEPHEADVTVEPYLTQGGTVTSVQMRAARVPQDGALALIEAVYAAQQQGLTLLCVDTGALDGGETLIAPSLTVEVGAAGSERSDIVSVVITGAGDASGGAYRARVEYCLAGGGWQPSDARETGVLSGPTAVSLNDVHDDICAVRITYIDDATGEEAVRGGFTPGQIALSVEASAQGAVNMRASAAFEGAFVYRTQPDTAVNALTRRAEAECDFTMQADGLFETVSAGRDGHISGVAFFDEDADGVMDAGETGRYAGLPVSLLTSGGEVVATARTDADGRYAFDTLSGGTYTVQFDAGDSLVFSGGSLYSSHVTSGVTDMREGTSDALPIDGEHTDYIVNVGCIFAAKVVGQAYEIVKGGEQVGFAGLNVEMRSADAREEEEPLVVVSGGMGDFGFGRVLPGRYTLTVQIPDGYLCAESRDGVIVRDIELDAGDAFDMGTVTLQKAASVRGAVRVDDDGDGAMAPDAGALSGVRVALLRQSESHSETVAETVTDEYGAYAFEDIYAGTYSVLFELDGDWAFTRYGADSAVYGAVAKSGATRSFALEPGDELDGVNAGVTIPATLRVTVFKDTHYDGQKGVYEEGLSDVQVALIRLEDGQDAEEIAYTTDENGTAVFEGVSPGEYVLSYSLPGQWRATKQVDPQTTNYPVSCVPQSAQPTGRSAPFTLTMGGEETLLYIGAMQSGTISGEVYYDDDADANRDEGEAACSETLVELLDSSEAVIAQADVAQDGSYAFEGLAPGRYTVRFTAPEGCGFSGTERTATRGGVQESDENVSTTRVIAVESRQVTASAHAGVVRLSTVSGLIWEDSDGDRTAGETERGMAGISVHLMDGAGRNILHTVATDEQGRFAFEELKPGTYKLRVDAQEDYVFSGAMEGGVLPLEEERSGRGYSQAFTLLGGAHVDAIGFGLLTQGMIGGVIWEDDDFDGVMDDEEAGLRGATVTLLDANGGEVAVKQTIRSGEFTFDQLMPGAYAIEVTLADGYRFTADGASHTPQGGGQRAQIALGTLEMGGSIADVRIGALRTATVGGVVWFDEDDDGRRASREAGMQGVHVLLEKMSGADAGTRWETTTDASGAYEFTGVTPGEAVLTFTLEDGYAFARQVSGTSRVSCVPALDALCAQSDVLTIAAGEDRKALDVGVVGVGTISGAVWEDSAYNGRMDGEEPGVQGALVELVDAVTKETRVSAQTDENGAYAMGFAREGEYVLRVTLPDGRIFTREGESVIDSVDDDTAETAAFALAMGESLDGLNVGAIVPAQITGRMAVDEDADGLCADGEPGFDGALVTAMQGGTVVATVRTDETGAFRFDTLRPGTYRLRYALGEDALFAPGVMLSMTDADAAEAETGEYALAMGETAHAGAVPVVHAGAITGRAFLDANVNGAMDAGEAAMTDVTVELLGEDGAVRMTAQTGSDGAYAFARLRPGTYSVRFTLGEGVLFTDYTGRAGDSCVPLDGTGTSESFTLAMGETRGNMHVGGILPGRIGDTVWHDRDGKGLQDYKEPLLADVGLTLLRVDDEGAMQEVASVRSDAYGYYAFDALRPGTYVLRLDARQGDTPTFSFGEPMGEIDSDINPDTGLSAPFVLQSGQTLRNIDVGLTDYAQ